MVLVDSLTVSVESLVECWVLPGFQKKCSFLHMERLLKMANLEKKVDNLLSESNISIFPEMFRFIFFSTREYVEPFLYFHIISRRTDLLTEKRLSLTRSERGNNVATFR